MRAPRRRCIGRMLLYAAFIGPTVYLSCAPIYQPLKEDQALLRVALRHVGQVIGDCRDRSAEELARLPANMRLERICPRARAPVRVRVEIDGRIWIDETHSARGLSEDGPVVVYHRWAIPAGAHRIRVQVADGPDPERFQHAREATVQLPPGRLLTVDFDPQREGIVLR